MHPLYCELGTTAEARQAAYRALFADQLDEKALDDIRSATNKAWVLSNDRFKARIAAQLERRVEPKLRGGDHKSAGYREKRQINRV